MNPVFEGANYANITSTTTVRTADGGDGLKLIGIFVASSTAGTIKVEDGATTVVNTFSPVAGVFYPIPCNLQTSLIVTIGGTVDCTVFWG